MRRDFIPPLRFPTLTRVYDPVTAEREWKGELVLHVADYATAVGVISLWRAA